MSRKRQSLLSPGERAALRRLAVPTREAATSALAGTANLQPRVDRLEVDLADLRGRVKTLTELVFALDSRYGIERKSGKTTKDR